VVSLYWKTCAFYVDAAIGVETQVNNDYMNRTHDHVGHRLLRLPQWGDGPETTDEGE